MIEVDVVKELDAPVSKVWEMLENFGNLDWYPGWDRIEVLGSGVGMTRREFLDYVDYNADRRLTSLGLATLCIASGMGAATIIERV